MNKNSDPVQKNFLGVAGEDGAPNSRTPCFTGGSKIISEGRVRSQKQNAMCCGLLVTYNEKRTK